MNTKKKPARASLPKSALARVCFIDREIASGKYPNCKQLAESWEGISISTINRDIDFIKNVWNAPIEYDALHRGYYYTEKNYRIPMSFTGADDLLALGMAKNILSLYKDTPIYNAAKQLLDSITYPLAMEGADGGSVSNGAGSAAAWYENRIVIPPVPSAPISQDAWEPITKALRENRVLVIEYMGAHDQDYKTRRVRPYQLLFDNGLWYLYGYAEERKGIRLYSLCRMRNITLAKESFKLPENFDYRANAQGSYFGVFAGEKKQKYKVAFSDYSATWVKDRKWAEDQKITKTKDGVVISFSSTQFEKVLEWTLSRGCTAYPLEPASLVKAWKNNVEKMRARACG